MLRLTRPLALVLAVTAVAAAQTTRSAEGGDELDRALEILRRLDGVATSVNYVDVPLEEVVEDLNWYIDVPLQADWEALAGLGIDHDTEVTLRLEDTPLSTVLAAVMLQLGTGFDRPEVEVFKAGMLVLTSKEGTERMRVTDVYDVRDLLADGRAVGHLRATAPSRAAEPEPEPEPEPAGDTGSGDAATQPGWKIPPRPDADPPSDPASLPRPVMTPGTELMLLICEHVDPEAWIDYGGTRASISERDGVLMVSAAPSVHRDFQEALRRLRRTYATRVMIDSAIVDVPRSLYERLMRRHDHASAGLARALMASSEAKILWRANAIAAMDEPLMFESKNEDTSISVEIMPAFDRATGVLSLEVEADSRHGDDERAVSTAVTVPSRNGGATLEMPAATMGDVVRLVVLIPRRS